MPFFFVLVFLGFVVARQGNVMVGRREPIKTPFLEVMLRSGDVYWSIELRSSWCSRSSKENFYARVRRTDLQCPVKRSRYLCEGKICMIWGSCQPGRGAVRSFLLSKKCVPLYLQFTAQHLLPNGAQKQEICHNKCIWSRWSRWMSCVFYTT